MKCLPYQQRRGHWVLACLQLQLGRVPIQSQQRLQRMDDERGLDRLGERIVGIHRWRHDKPLGDQPTPSSNTSTSPLYRAGYSISTLPHALTPTRSRRPKRGLDSRQSGLQQRAGVPADVRAVPAAKRKMGLALPTYLAKVRAASRAGT